MDCEEEFCLPQNIEMTNFVLTSKLSTNVSSSTVVL